MLSLPVALFLLPGCGPATCFDRFEEVGWIVDGDAPADDSWPQYRREVTHAGVAHPSSSIGTAPTLTWETEPYAIGEYTASKSSPTVHDGTVYVGVDDGRLLAVDQATGDLRWSFETRQAEVEEEREDVDNRGIHGTAAVADGRVFIGDYSGWLYALDEETGALLWEVDLGGSIGASPVLYQDHVLMAVEFPDPDGKVFVVDQQEGCVVWETEYLGNHPHSSVTVDPTRGMFFVGANNGRFTAFDLTTQELAWEAWMEDDDEDGDSDEIKSTAAVAGDHVYITSWDGWLHVYDIDSGAVAWEYDTGRMTMSSPSVHDGVVYVGNHDGKLMALDDDPATPAEERLRWSWQASARILSSPTVIPADGTVVVGSDAGQLVILDLADGAELWEHLAEGRASSVPTVVGDALYLYDGSGRTARFDP